jgi:YD repeat-containing protein
VKKQSHVRALGNTDGNFTSDGHWTYSWDAENRLTAMEEKTSTRQPSGLKEWQRLEFRYDAGGRRIA